MSRARDHNSRSACTVVHLSTVHQATDSRIFHREARSLAEAGFRVIVAACASRPATRHDVIIRPLIASRSRLVRMLVRPWLALAVTLRERPDVVHFHDPELVPVGLLLRLIPSGRPRVIYDVHEDLPRQLLAKTWIPATLRPLLARWLDRIEPWSAKHFDLVVAASEPIAKRFGRSQTMVVRNLPRWEDFSTDAPRAQLETLAYPATEDDGGDRDGPRIVYTGALGPERGTKEMVEAIDRCDPALGIRLVLAGPADPGEIDAVRLLDGWRRTEYLGVVSPENLPHLLGTASVGLVLLHPMRHYQEAYPTKLFEYMAAGLPVIASNFPLWRPIIEGIGCGLLVDPLDPEGIASAMMWLVRHPEDADSMGRRGRDAVRSTYTWETEASRLVERYDQLLGISPADASAGIPPGVAG
jgi:glycosyltransferase involved in cell wall biosynthesis